MDSYTLAMIGNVALTALAFGLFLDPFDWWGGDDDEDEDIFVEPADPDETVALTPGDDVFSGGSGDDTVFADAGDDEVSGEAGDDALFGGEGADLLDGGSGDDRLDGNAGDDRLLGGEVDDTLTGGAGTDTLDGGAGNDLLISDRLDENADFSRGGAESLSGGTGDDVLIMSSGDSASGGEGEDAFGLVVVGEEPEPAVIEDYDTATESLAIYYDPAEFDDQAPELSLSVDSDNDLTQVLLNGQEVLTLQGVQDLDPETIELLTEEQLAG
ncbi:calcium-binding protein [Marinibacterium profundimaris]|uniref:calcium-binding protein n=1 Tax=Marinibacterium profundimaris TaxID=1679460 RepID=UPI000B522302|nr:calcium-binding protein [Marinibacterium profundimaris]